MQDLGTMWQWIEDSPFLFKDPVWYNTDQASAPLQAAPPIRCAQMMTSENNFINLQTKIVGRIRFRQVSTHHIVALITLLHSSHCCRVADKLLQMRLRAEECALPEIRDQIPQCFASWSTSDSSEQP